MKDVRRRTVRSGPVALSVVEYGDSAHPPVVLLHGYPDNKDVWSLVAERLADRFHVVLYDVRGHGESSAPHPLRGGFRLESLTEDFLAVVDAVSPDRPVHLVGHDWGSVQGWEFATVARCEERIASFTSVAGPSLDHFGHWIQQRLHRPTPRRIAQLLGQHAKSWYVYALRTPVLPELAWHGALGRRWPAMLARSERLPTAETHPTSFLPRDAANGAWLYRDNVHQRLRHPRTDPYARVPVQLITPTRDPFLSPHLYDDLERWAPGLVRRTLPVRHWVPRTRPDQLAFWISQFALHHEPGEEESERDPLLTVAPGPQATGSAPGSGPAGPNGSDREATGSERETTGSERETTGSGPRRRPGADGATTRISRREGTTSAGRAGPDRLRVARDPLAERFGGQLVLVTGAGSGIGRATALAFADAGARIVAADRDSVTAAQTAALARDRGASDAWPETVDVSDEHAMDDFAHHVAGSYGVVDVLVNNAGIGLAGAFLDTKADEWRAVLDVNLWGVIHGCRLFARQMTDRGQGGHIVNVSSAAAFQPSRALSAYSTSKAAVLMLSECLRAELAPHGIGVTAVCPGFINTNITTSAHFTGVSAPERDRLRAKAARLYGLRNYPPEHVAAAVLRAVVRNTAVLPVTPEAATARLLSRLAPSTLRALARIKPPL